MTAAQHVVRQIPTRTDVIQKHKSAGGRIAAVFPIHYPRSLFRAHGVLPVEVWGPPGIDRSQGDTHIQTYACSIVSSGLAFLMKGGLRAADMIVVPHACDSLQGLGSILLDFINPEQPVMPFYIPRTTRETEEAARVFFVAELQAIAQQLKQITEVEPNTETLLAAVQREEEADRLLGQLVDARPFLPFTDRELYTVIRAREYLPAETFIEVVKQALEMRQEEPQTGLYLLLSGILPEPMEIFDPIADAGGLVVADDFACAGRRIYPSGRSNEPLARMAERLLGGPPDSTLGCSIEQRADHLIGLARKTKAKGVLFYEVKFCEPELFYLPQVRGRLEKAGIRSIQIDGDLSATLSQQASTRIEAFLETLQ